jgi:hypothetical protein
VASSAYNPLSKRNLGDNVAKAAIEGPIHSLPPDKFAGAGVYLIYYFGDFSAYRLVAEHNRGADPQFPIYVGKAVPKGARKGGFGLDEDPGYVLHSRLAEHASSIQHATNLDIEDFSCRFLVVDDIWIPLAESLLIETYEPIWNKQIDGFGNHDPGSGRRKQRRSPWDALHPGRPWAELLDPPSSGPEDIAEKAELYLGRVVQTWHNNSYK